MGITQQQRFSDTSTKPLHVRIPVALHEGLNKLAIQEKNVCSQPNSYKKQLGVSNLITLPSSNSIR